MPRNIICVICAALTIGCAAEFNPNLGGLDGSETGDSTTDVGTADTGSETDTSGSTTGETSTGSTDETGSTGDGDGDTGTETGDGDMPGPGDDCSPLGELCPESFTCVADGWTGDIQNYHCDLLAPGFDGGLGDECSAADPTTCSYGFCNLAQSLSEGFCGGAYSCCSPWCNPLNGHADCPMDMECFPIPDMYLPAYIQDEGGLGHCWAP